MKNPELIETIIYGGAFNPPTLAHLAILQACVEYARPRSAEVWIMPSGDRRDKTIAVDRERRLEYVTAMADDAETEDVPVDLLLSELDRHVSVETYDTVLELDEQFPDRSFTWVFGADSTETMHDWKEGDWLLENLSMLAIEREGSRINPLAKRAMALTVPSLAVSSTMVRARLAAHESVDDLVSPRVAELLYK